MGMGIERFSEELNLTSEQLSKIKSVWFDLHKRAIEVRAKIQLAELELRELMDADTPNESQVKGKIEVIGKLRTDLRLARVEGMMSIHQVLSAEQKAKLKELRQENRAERREERPRMQRRQGLQGFRGFNNNFEFDDMELVPEAPDESEEI
jgi:Spy/CpxP family protein refolding chaperone